MGKRKIRVIIDECISSFWSFKRSENTANIKNFLDVGIPRGADDTRILDAGQKYHRLIYTFDKRGGYDLALVTNPSYRDTGVLIVPGDYEDEEVDEALYNLSIKCDQEELTGSRTRLTINWASILSGKNRKVRKRLG